MNLQQYERDLLSLRDKFTQKLNEKTINNSSNPVQTDSNNHYFYVNLPYSYETPIKPSKNKPKIQLTNDITFDKSQKTNIIQKQNKYNTTQNMAKYEQKRPLSAKIQRKDDLFDNKLIERQKQLKECMQRNERLLNKSKQIRNIQSKHNSATKINNKAIEADVKISSDKANIQNLKSILAKDYAIKDRNQISHRKTSLLNNFLDNPQKSDKQVDIQKKKRHIEQHFGEVKLNFTQKMNNILKQCFNGNERSKEMANNKKASASRDVKPFAKKDLVKYKQQKDYYTSVKVQSSKDSMIKTPIKPSKHYQQPLKMKSVRQDTKSLQERIKVLLSK